MKLRRQKQRKHSTRAANRHGACTTKKREGWLSETFAGAASRASFVLLKDARLAGSCLRNDATRDFNEKKETSRPITRRVTRRVTSRVTRIVARVVTRTLFRAVYYITESPRALERRRRRRLARRAPYFFFFPSRPRRVFRVISDPTERDRLAAHALVTFAASMSVTAFLPARTCAWTRSMAAAASVSSRAARAEESPLRERNRL